MKYIIVEKNNRFYPKQSFLFGLIHIPFFANRREIFYHNFDDAKCFLKDHLKEQLASSTIHEIYERQYNKK